MKKSIPMAAIFVLIALLLAGLPAQRAEANPDTWLQTTQTDFEDGVWAGVTTEQSPGNVMLVNPYSDEFEGTTLDLTKWNWHPGTEAGSTYPVGGGSLSITCPGTDGTIYADVTKLPYVYQIVSVDFDVVAFSQTIVPAQPDTQIYLFVWDDTVGVVGDLMALGAARIDDNFVYRWYRSIEAGGALDDVAMASESEPHYLRITRVGDIFSAYYSTDGINWDPVGPAQPGGGQFPNPQIGLASWTDSGTPFTTDWDWVRMKPFPTSGTVASQVLNTGVAGSTWDELSWNELTSGNTNITFDVRASDTPFAANDGILPWIDLGTADSAITTGLPPGQYMQWQATLLTTVTSETPVLRDVTVEYITAPTVDIDVSDTLINEADALGTFDVVATFSEAMNTSVPPTISFSPDVVASGTLTSPSYAWSVGDTVYTATYNVADVNEEEADVDVSVDGAEDLAGNPQDPDPTTEANLFDVDTVAPTVAITSTATDPTNTSPIPVTATFSEDVTGFELGDIAVGNGTASNFNPVSGTVYTFDVTPTADGVVTVDITAVVAQDAAGNPNTAATQFTITYDSVAPPPAPRGAVGGTVYPIDKSAILMPWLISGAVLILAAGGLILIRRRS